MSRPCKVQVLININLLCYMDLHSYQAAYMLLHNTHDYQVQVHTSEQENFAVDTKKLNCQKI